MGSGDRVVWFREEKGTGARVFISQKVLQRILYYLRPYHAVLLVAKVQDHHARLRLMSCFWW